MTRLLIPAFTEEKLLYQEVCFVGHALVVKHHLGSQGPPQNPWEKKGLEGGPATS
jgi:hypothetical protein